MGLKLASATDRAIGRPLEPAEAYEAAGQFEQALVEIGTSFVADAEPFELVQPGEGALDHPAYFCPIRSRGRRRVGRSGV
jgi:hypothetical protein